MGGVSFFFFLRPWLTISVWSIVESIVPSKIKGKYSCDVAVISFSKCGFYLFVEEYCRKARWDIILWETIDTTSLGLIFMITINSPVNKL